ncbi:hypothetical protein Q4575_19425 [Psychrosphaera sp. 1_MG-2023]|uniref:hypothetical protein n=1 Tax=Psychrosphaera sp. 1_MG-2023 TaxID=3062643 RepID=UPI0026E33BCD|nr:hypothetical protein [Psychrosphaera sp. 1_MG-2023]MDO6721582.1 hypothetical protein [Psychrosphaera sp. 1_MG-2023]
MYRALTLIFAMFSFCVSAEDKCDQVVSGYESSDVMYVICDNLSGLTLKEANQTLEHIFEQYKGPPDEILVYFVSSKKLVGVPEKKLKPEDLIGIYYTHDSILTAWPYIESRKKEYQLKWW